MYLQYFFEKRFEGSDTLLSVHERVIGFEIIPEERTELFFLSPPIRYAAMAYASFRKTGKLTEDTFQYLGECYQELHDGISGSDAHTDLFYACCIVFKATSAMKELPGTLHSHICGLYQLLKSLYTTQVTVPKWEWQWMEGLWLDCLVRYYGDLNELRVRDFMLFPIQIQQMRIVLEDYALHGPTFINPQLSEVRYWVIVRLKFYLVQYFFHYLLLVEGVLEAGDLNNSHKQIAFITGSDNAIPSSSQQATFYEY